MSKPICSECKIAYGTLEDPIVISDDEELGTNQVLPDSVNLTTSATTTTSDDNVLFYSEPENAVDDLRKNGYVLLKKELFDNVPIEDLTKLKTYIEEDTKDFMNPETGNLQEVALEDLSNKEMKTLMIKTRDNIINELQKIFKASPYDLYIPEGDEWKDTMYARVKVNNTMTPRHCDAYNTLVQRGVLKGFDNWSPEQWENYFINNKNKTDSEIEWDKIPVFTFWSSLLDVHNGFSSHLQIHPGTHKMPNNSLSSSRSTIIQPFGYKFKKSNFKSPAFGPNTGYSAGDVLVFHCLTQHLANVHNETPSVDAKEKRYSIDGRFYYKIPKASEESSKKKKIKN
jgi:hypothetical protein